MNELIIEQTPKTPQIDLNQLTGDLLFYGRSIPENATKLYEPVLNWVTEYILAANPTTNLRLDLEYFNTASSIYLAKMLKVLTRINVPEYVLIIHLYFPVEEFNEMNEFEDINDAFSPITDIFHDTSTSIGIKLYAKDDRSEIIKTRLVFIEHSIPQT
jgi:SiaC family regulatory phosphoprotein